jgi:hypothetical protein
MEYNTKEIAELLDQEVMVLTCVLAAVVAY